MANYLTTDTELQSVANAIRTKGGTSEQLSFPEGFVSAIGDISTGITPTGNINITNTQQTNVTNYATAQVVDANLVAGNIKNGVSILGVNGTFGNELTPVSQETVSGTIYSCYLPLERSKKMKLYANDIYIGEVWCV